MEMLVMAVGSYQTNCYMLWQKGREDCVLIDPGSAHKEILEIVEKQGKTVAAILLTHGHFDHVGAVRKIAEQAKCPVYLCPEEKKLPVFMTAGPLYSTDGYGDSVCVAGLQFEVLPTPGHTPGSVCYRIENELFTGDTLFEHGWGRTDFPGGDEHALFASLRRIMPIAQTIPFHPGHET